MCPRKIRDGSARDYPRPQLVERILQQQDPAEGEAEALAQDITDVPAGYAPIHWVSRTSTYHSMSICQSSAYTQASNAQGKMAAEVA